MDYDAFSGGALLLGHDVNISYSHLARYLCTLLISGGKHRITRSQSHRRLDLCTIPACLSVN